jgi:hypothetical protein
VRLAVFHSLLSLCLGVGREKGMRPNYRQQGTKNEQSEALIAGCSATIMEPCYLLPSASGISVGRRGTPSSQETCSCSGQPSREGRIPDYVSNFISHIPLFC